MKLTRKQKLQLSPTARAIRGGMMRFKRRLDIPMFHVDHIGQAEQILSDTVDELKRLKQSNSLRDADRLIYAQGALLAANKRLAVMAPSDPRQRGAEHLVYDPDLKDERGILEVSKLEKNKT